MKPHERVLQLRLLLWELLGTLQNLVGLFVKRERCSSGSLLLRLSPGYNGLTERAELHLVLLVL